ncbi:uncharacterized membrane protein (DUF441 family) [Salirhabdus euzebyi]|uniref:UPF0756 membrane protein HNQ94_000506 n=1 Tax=Salirhabdus euzebyi TaxID=394506 RepID=A0A841Q213_9BACI|nr:DUF441 domain-containing protein [Salirhabdus euzebyi]MBB6452085.1 uncharacterized membrane protein (DUF441 family) [Salirhabdus euzebyi]
MFSQPTLFLFILLALGYIAKNQAIMVAVYILLGVKLFNVEDKILPYFEAKGLTWGIIIITIAVFAPIASGDIGFKDLLDSVKSYYAWICLAAGMFVAYVARGGLDLLANDPHLTAALIIGTILGIVIFNGIAVGPLIGAGIAVILMKMVDFVLHLFA